jgi:23S rRNA (uracil1939-C5)-methyltransferase
MKSRREWHRDEVVDVSIESLTYEGKGVAHVEGMAVFLRGALPGDTVKARLTRIKKSYAEAQVVAVTQPSPWRVEPRCPHFGVCGGCASQDLLYEKQVEYKTRQVRETLQHIGGLNVEVRPALAMADPWRYRNKMEFAFGESDGRVYLGLMQRGSFDTVVEIKECFLSTERTMVAVRFVEGFGRQLGEHPLQPRSQTGSLRHLVVREGRRTGDLLLNLVTTSALAADAALVSAAAPASPSTVLWTHNDSRAAVVQGDWVHILAGSGELTERIGHLTLSVGPFSFLQTNSEQVEVLYAEVARQAALTGDETVLDLYCGVGAIGLYLAGQARQVVGVDSVAEAIGYAVRNAEQNGIGNATFQCAEVEALSTLTFGAINPDVIIVDPPRAGLHPRLLATLLEQKAERLIYVSCNPAALARDLKALSEIYDIGPVQPVDMFPHTWHVETVVVLRHRSSMSDTLSPSDSSTRVRSRPSM